MDMIQTIMVFCNTQEHIKALMDSLENAEGKGL